MMKNITNEELELRLKEFVSKEKLLLHIILDHIKEVDSRKLYLERAYPSLYEYLVKELGYSGSAAIRRQEAARLLKEIPELGQKIRSGSINLSQINELTRAIKQKEKLNYQKTQNRKLSQVSTSEKSAMLLAIENKTVPETQKIISKNLDLPILHGDVIRIQKDGSARLEITLTQEQYNLLLQCKDLAAHSLKQQNQDLSWGSVITYTAARYIRKTTPHAKKTSREKNIPKKKETAHLVKQDQDQTRTKVIADQKSTTTSMSASTLNTTGLKINPNLTSNQRQEILNRDLWCQYKDPLSGKICGSTFGLEVDHKVPKWTQILAPTEDLKDPSNLQVLCANHNKHKYRKECNVH